jgi:hypothetical protein
MLIARVFFTRVPFAAHLLLLTPEMNAQHVWTRDEYQRWDTVQDPGAPPSDYILVDKSAKTRVPLYILSNAERLCSNPTGKYSLF